MRVFFLIMAGLIPALYVIVNIVRTISYMEFSSSFALTNLVERLIFGIPEVIAISLLCIFMSRKISGGGLGATHNQRVYYHNRGGI